MGRNRGQVYTIDAILSAVFLLSLLTVLLYVGVLQREVRRYTPPDRILGVLLNDPDFIQAVYAGDLKRVEAILNAYLGNTKYELAVYDGSGRSLIFRIGSCDGVASVGMLAGVNGTLNPRIICLKVEGGSA